MTKPRIGRRGRPQRRGRPWQTTGAWWARRSGGIAHSAGTDTAAAIGQRPGRHGRDITRSG